MAAAIYTSDLTSVVGIDNTVALGNWAAIGGGASGLNVEEDYFIQSNGCVSKNAFASATKGMVEDTTNVLLSVGDLSAVYMWVTHLTPGSLDTKALGGLAVCMGSASNTLNRYNYAGSDTIDYGAPWICAVVDPENTTASSGTVIPADINTYGIEAKLVGGPTKGAPLAVDTIRQGRSYDITEGDAAAPATFQEASTKNDLQANRYGQFQQVKGGFSMQCRMGFGTAAAGCYFEDSNKSITLEDLEFVDPGFIEFEVLNAATVLKWTNMTIAALGANTKGNFKVTSSLSVEHNTCTFVDMGTFNYDPNSTPNGTTYRRCDRVKGGTLTDCTIEESTNNVASEYPSTSDLIRARFIGTGSNHAVSISNIFLADVSMDWDCTFDAATYAVVDGSVGNEVILVNVPVGITLTINVTDTANTPTVNNTGSGTVNVVSGQKTFTFVIDPSITSYEWRLYEKDLAEGTIGTVELAGEETAATDNQSYSYTYVSDKTAVLQIIADGFEESLTTIDLKNSDLDRTINLKTEENT